MRPLLALSSWTSSPTWEIWTFGSYPGNHLLVARPSKMLRWAFVVWRCMSWLQGRCKTAGSKVEPCRRTLNLLQLVNLVVVFEINFRNPMKTSCPAREGSKQSHSGTLERVQVPSPTRNASWCFSSSTAETDPERVKLTRNDDAVSSNPLMFFKFIHLLSPRIL